MPGFLLPLGGALREVRWAFLTYLAGLILVFARWWAWYGGWVWGPRFFAIGSTLACLAMADAIGTRRPARLQWLVAGIVAWSAWVSVNGTVFELHGVEVCLDNYQHQFEFLCWYIPEFSPLFRPFVVPKALTTADLVLLGYHAVVAGWLIWSIPGLRGAGFTQRLGAARARLTHGWRW